MTGDYRALHQLSPKFIIPVGTQVVLKAAKTLPDGQYRKPGTVGVVVESPPHNGEPYVVQFADGNETRALFAELVLRRKEIEAELGNIPDDLTRFIIYRCQVGSKAYGLAEDDADDDWRGIYLPPAGLQWSIYRLPEQLETRTDARDEVYWELEKYLLLALKANPNVLETLWTPLVLYTSPLADELRQMRGAFLSQHLFKTYSGYVLSQFRRMAAAVRAGHEYKPKHAMHLVRLLYSGIHALRTGEIQVDVSSRREELLRIKRGELSFDEVKQQAQALEREFQGAFEATHLPEQPDFAGVNAFLIRARRSMVDV